MNIHRKSPAGFLVAVALAVLIKASLGSAENEVTSVNKNCGLYCMYATFSWFGEKVDPNELMKPEYLSKPEGSTLEDLTRIAREYGFHARAVQNLNLASLERSPYPIICSTRKLLNDKVFNHYVVVFPGPKRAKAAYDPLDDSFVSLVDLGSGLWSGYGLVVSRDPINLWQLFWRDYLLIWLAIPAMLFLRWLLRWYQQRNKGKKVRHFAWNVGGEGLLILSMAIFAAMVVHLSLSASPFFSSAKTIQAIQERNIGAFLEHIDATELQHAMQKGAVVIDARRVEDFNAGHIPDAINLSPWSEQDVFDRVLKDWPTDKNIVIYCQSAGCPYAPEVAKTLWDRGYTQIEYYKPGWIDWSQRIAKEGQS